MKIWLDDERPEPKGWWRARNYREAVRLLRWAFFIREPIEEMSFDHDLGDFVDGREFTGYDVLCYIEKLAAEGEREGIPQKMTIHSANAGSRKKMELTIRSIQRLTSHDGSVIL